MAQRPSWALARPLAAKGRRSEADMTKAYTQMLRAFIETDPPKNKKSRGGGEGGRGRRKSEHDAAKLEMSEVARQLGPDAWPWFGPMLIFDCETETKIG